MRKINTYSFNRTLTVWLCVAYLCSGQIVWTSWPSVETGNVSMKDKHQSESVNCSHPLMTLNAASPSTDTSVSHKIPQGHLKCLRSSSIEKKIFFHLVNSTEAWLYMKRNNQNNSILLKMWNSYCLVSVRSSRKLTFWQLEDKEIYQTRHWHYSDPSDFCINGNLIMIQFACKSSD